MASLAAMLQKSGYHISGSDEGIYPPMSDFLARARTVQDWTLSPLLKAIPVDLPRKPYSLNNFLSLKPLLEVMPEIEKVVNHRLTRLKNSS